MKTARLFKVLLVALAGAGAAQAHTDDVLDTMKPPNGGQQRMAGAYHFELVVSRQGSEAGERPVLVYVTDHGGTKLPTAGASGTATLLAGKTKASVSLVPDGDNRLRGMARYASTPDLKVVVSVTMAGKSAEQARFTPIEAVPAAHGKH